MKNYEYQTFSYLLFQGFYESLLFNSDTMYNITYNDRGEYEIDENGKEVPVLAENEEWDIVGDNWNKFQKDVCEQAAYLLWDNLEIGQDIIKDIKFKSMSSPAYYNYESDKLNLLIDFDLRKLKKYCFKIYKNDFNKYLNKFWSSRDGFSSFIPSCLSDFIAEYNDGDSVHRDRCMNVMIEFYLLCNVNNTKNCDNFDNDNSYQWNLIEYADQCVYNYMEKIKI